MISRGRALIDNRFYVRDGILTLDLDKPTYERCGLQGKPAKSAGRQHVKQRFGSIHPSHRRQETYSRTVVEINLRLSCMVRGKKGFERIVWAFTRVLTDPVSWLFIDLESEGCPSIDKHLFDYQKIEPSVVSISNAIVPLLGTEEASKDPNYQEQLVEWLGLVFLESPLVQTIHKVDPYICRYNLPEAYLDAMRDQRVQELEHFQWRGLIPPKIIKSLASQLQQKDHWFALKGQTFEGSSYTLLGVGEKEVWSWETGP